MQRWMGGAAVSLAALWLAGSATAQDTDSGNGAHQVVARGVPQGGPASGVPHGTRNNEIMQVKITVSDMDRSLKYYQDGIGLVRASSLTGGRKPPPGPPPAMPAGFRETPLNFTGSLAEAYLTLMQEAGHVPTAESAHMTVVAIKVKDVRATLARLKAAGYPIGEVRDMGGGFKLSFVNDPDGYRLELIESPKLAPSPGD